MTIALAIRRNNWAWVSIDRLTSTRTNTLGRSRRTRRQEGCKGTPPVARLLRRVRRRSRRRPLGCVRQRLVSRRISRRAMRSANVSSWLKSWGSHCVADRSCKGSVRLAPPKARSAPASVASPVALSASLIAVSRDFRALDYGSVPSCSCNDCTTWRRSLEGRARPLLRMVPRTR